MSRVPTDISWERVVRTLKKAGFGVLREGPHTTMTNGELLIVIPRHPRIKRETLRAIIRDAGLTPEKFRELL